MRNLFYFISMSLILTACATSVGVQSRSTEPTRDVVQVQDCGVGPITQGKVTFYCVKVPGTK